MVLVWDLFYFIKILKLLFISVNLITCQESCFHIPIYLKRLQQVYWTYSRGKGLEFKPIFANLIGCSLLLTEVNVSLVHRHSSKFNYFSYF